MTTSHRIAQQIILALGAGITLGCIIGSIVIAIYAMPPFIVAILPKSPTPTSTATRPATITLAPTRTATLTRTPIPPSDTPTLVPPTSPNGTPSKATASKTPLPAPTPRPIVTHFMVGRPVAPSADSNSPSRWYYYGTTQGGEYVVHHGEEFVNRSGTPLYAVADGTVVTAGNDIQPICGSDGKTVCGEQIYPKKGFYGNLVVIKLAQSYKGQPVFALYGHMSQITVAVGDNVTLGDPIGEVGASGIADGPHVHFEIRVGVNDYGHTRNPILWMPPLPGRGAIVGRFSDSKGNLIRGALVDLYRSDGTFDREIETYGDDKWPDVNSDDDLNENFAIPDLATGDYVVRIRGQQYAQRISVQDGKLSFVELGGVQ